MDHYLFEKLKHRAIEAPLININVDYCDLNFKVKELTDSTVNSTGLLEVGLISSPNIDFLLRWDEKEKTIDVDMKPKNKPKRVNGFEGHHTKKLSGSPMAKYLINIKLKRRLIFKGTIELILKTSNRIEKSLGYAIKLP
jgi:hypothetical protein